MLVMANRLRKTIVLGIVIAAICVLGSCRKDLYYSNSDIDGPQVYINAMWPSDLTTIPSGIRAIFYPTAGGTPIVRNILPAGGYVAIPKGTYNVVLFNNDTEYVKLYNTDTDSTLEARTTTILASAKVKSFPSQDIVNLPDSFYSYKIKNFNVTGNSLPDILSAPLQNKVKFFNVRVNIGGTGGVSYVSSATGYISGLYGSFFPGLDTYPSTNSAITFNFSNKGADYLQGTVSTFGVNCLSGNTQMFKSSLTLTDGRTLEYDCDITSLLNIDLSKPNQVVTIPGTIDVSAGSSSGFNVNVNDWGNSTSVDI